VVVIVMTVVGMALVVVSLVVFSFFSSSFVPLGDSLLGFVNFDLSNFSISLISIHGIGSKVESGSVDPSFITNLGHGSRFVVIRHLHGASIDGILHTDDFHKLSAFFFHFIQSPVRTDFQNFFLFVFAVFLTIYHGASVVVLGGSHARTGEFIIGETEQSSLTGGVFLYLICGERFRCIGKGVIVSGEHLIEYDTIGVFFGNPESVSISNTESHTIL
jgi:hypothetical protein